MTAENPSQDHIDRLLFSMSSLSDIGETLTSTGDFNATLRSLLHLVLGVLTISKGAVLLYDPTMKILSVRTSRGLRGTRPPMALEEEWVRDLTRENLPLERAELVRIIPNLGGERDSCLDQLQSHFWVPLVARNRLMGILSVSDRFMKQPYSEQDLSLLATMARHIAVGIYNHTLMEETLAVQNYNQNILTSIASGVISTDLDGRIVSVNQSAERILRLEGDKLVGTMCKRLSRHLNNEGITNLMKTVEDTGARNEVSQLNCRIADSQLVLDVSVAPLINQEGNLSGLVIALDDLSEESRIRNIFKRYVSDRVVDMVLHPENRLSLGGEHRDIVVVFTDLRGFTRMQEEQGPEATVLMLNEYYEAMVEVIVRHNGTLSRIAGDGLMILYGAPISFEDKMERAIQTVLDMRDALNDLNEQREAAGKEPLGMGIGISSGHVLAGNIGSPQRMEYTVIGDPVNLAARLVDIAEGGQILISDDVYQQIKDHFFAGHFRTIRVKGKQRPVHIYELLGAKGEHEEEEIVPLKAQTIHTPSSEMELTIPMLPEMELAAGKTAAAAAEFMGLEKDKVEEIRLALIEACINAIEHSNSKERKVHISFSMGEEELVITIQDFGEGFEVDDMRQHLEERASDKTLLKRGWGLTIMEELMDVVEVISSKKGTTIRMVKRR